VRKNEFFHRDLDLHLVFPTGWKIINQPDRLLGVSTDAEQLMQFVMGDSSAKNPKSYLRKTFPGLKSGQSLSDGIYAGESPLDSPWGKRNGRVAAIRHKGNVFVVMGVGKSALSESSFNATLKSISRLTPEQQKLARGRKLKLIQARSGDTFASLAKQSNIDQFEISTLRLLNDLYPDGEPQAEQYIKIVK
jgi:predicted Zn-dependent protease